MLAQLLMNLGEFQGKEASEQRIRELCGGMISGESPVSPVHSFTPHTASAPGPLSSPPSLSSDLKERDPLPWA